MSTSKVHITAFSIILFLLTFLNLHAQTCIPSTISFENQQAIDDFATDYPGCTEILGTVFIREDSSGAIKNLNGLSSLKAIRGSLFIENNDSLTNLDGLDQLEAIGGDFELTENNAPSFINLRALLKLSSIGGFLRISENGALVNLKGLNSLTSVGAGLSVGGNPSLLSLKGLENFESIGGALIISSNTSLLDLLPLSRLNAINGRLGILANTSLVSLNGLEQIDPNTINHIFIAEENKLSDCTILPICEYLSTSSNAAIITANAMGCRTRQEILDACLTGLSNEPSDAAISIFPNPSHGPLEVRTSYGTNIIDITLMDNLGRKILVSKGTQNLDLSVFPSGMYMVAVNTKNGMTVKRVVKK